MDVIEQLRALVTVVDTTSFTKAGARLNKSKAVISKHVSELEARLGVKLLFRTTRKVSPTDVGGPFVERARYLIEDYEELVDSVRNEGQAPAGRLRITAPQSLGEREVMELINAFRNAYPDIRPEIFLTDRHVDLVAEGFDVALRATAMVDSAMIVRKLCNIDVLFCAAPDYLAAHGRPTTPADLQDHTCITDGNMRAPDLWRFKRLNGDASDPADDAQNNADDNAPDADADAKPDHAGARPAANGHDAPAPKSALQPFTVRVTSTLQVNSAAATRHAALAGIGIAALPEFVIGTDVRDGRLVELFPGQSDYNLSLHMLYPHRQYLAGRTRAFINFAADWYGGTRPWQA
ncbi:MAG: LysR family transcriptional regulator [Pseudomonadota bacterium]